MRLIMGALRLALESLAVEGFEKVGFLLGVRKEDSIEVTVLYRVDNELRSAVEFRANPWQTVQAHNIARLYNMEVVALYHTHSTCPPRPSTLDIKGMKLWPIPWVIACRGDIKAWKLQGDNVEEVRIE